MKIVPLLVLLCLAAGCASTNKSHHIIRTSDAIVDGRNADAEVPANGKVLWQYRTGLAALRRWNLPEAKSLLDDALARIGGIYGTDASAKKARGYFSEESKKTFIGEPYERVMAYYYRGILYWMDGEVDNARAC